MDERWGRLGDVGGGLGIGERKLLERADGGAAGCRGGSVEARWMVGRLCVRGGLCGCRGGCWVNGLVMMSDRVSQSVNGTCVWFTGDGG